MAEGEMNVELTVGGPTELVSRYYPNGKWGGLTIEGACLGALGDRVTLTVTVLKPRLQVALDGKIGWARRKATRELNLAWGVDVADTSDVVWEKLLAVARQELQPEALRSAARIEVALPVRLSWANKESRETLIDLSVGGAFVRTHEAIPAGMQVGLAVRVPGALLATRLSGRVAWTRHIGAAPGIGIRFDAVSPDMQKIVQRLMERVTRG